MIKIKYKENLSTLTEQKNKSIDVCKGCDFSFGNSCRFPVDEIAVVECDLEVDVEDYELCNSSVDSVWKKDEEQKSDSQKKEW